MKTAGRENPNRWATLFSNRAPGAGGQNRSCSITWAAKRGNGQPLERCFFLTSTFIERSREPLSSRASDNGLVPQYLEGGELKGVYLLPTPTIRNAKAIVRSTTRRR